MHFHLLAPQGALGGLAFSVGSNPSNPLIAFECVAVLPPSVVQFWYYDEKIGSFSLDTDEGGGKYGEGRA